MKHAHHTPQCCKSKTRSLGGACGSWKRDEERFVVETGSSDEELLSKLFASTASAHW